MIDNERAAETFCNAIRLFADKPDNLNNLESYLIQHFPEWLKKYARTPEELAAELMFFASMDI